MQTRIVLLLGLAVLLACAMTRKRVRMKSSWSQHLSGWQKLFGVLAVAGALLIILNPEFLALGLVGDTAFFEALVLALSLQMHAYAIRIYRRCVAELVRAVKWMGIPSPGFRYLLAVSVPAIDRLVSAFLRLRSAFFHPL